MSAAALMVLGGVRLLVQGREKLRRRSCVGTSPSIHATSLLPTISGRKGKAAGAPLRVVVL